MGKSDEDRLNRQFDRMEGRLPGRVGRFFRWLRKPSSRWVRIPFGTVLVLGGIFSFLPVLGIWMLPLGLLLLAQDMPFLRPPMLSLLESIERIRVRRRKRTRRRDRR